MGEYEKLGKVIGDAAMRSIRKMNTVSLAQM